MSTRCIVWFRKDLRLEDNPILQAAAKYEKVLPVFIFDKSLYEYKNIGSASLWWLEKSLTNLNYSLSGNLLTLVGESCELIAKLCDKFSADAVFWNRCYEPDRIAKDKKIKHLLSNNNVNAISHNSSLLWEPWTIKNKTGNFYKVFTPFYKRGCLESVSPRLPLEKPMSLNFERLSSVMPEYKFTFINKKKHWSQKFNKHWSPGEEAAKKRFQIFLNQASSSYDEGRNYPSKELVSRLSPHLHWGEISPFYVWHKSKESMTGNSKEIFLSELAWREFSYYLLYHFPKINSENLKSNYDNFKWENNIKHIDLWKQGKTGYPIVDAGMRELWNTGYMHNRSRMITSSFLVKNLLSHWKYGEKWFWDCLLDADMASNSASWQWVAGTGTDSAPFFRIFNPITQAEKFDKDALYIKRFIPELSKLPRKYIFSPWTASNDILEEANIKLGVNYPKPIIDYKFSRNRALDEFKTFSNKNS